MGQLVVVDPGLAELRSHARSPARDARSPARDARSPARDARSPARETVRDVASPASELTLLSRP